jgi:hypothetical protein
MIREWIDGTNLHKNNNGKQMFFVVTFIIKTNALQCSITAGHWYILMAL